MEQIILKCTQKSVDRRYGSMTELIDDLKHSLLDPNGRFVTLTPLASHAQTIMLSPDELDAIREGRSGYAVPPQERVTRPQYEEPEEEYEEDEEEYDDDEEDGEISSKLEKAMTIGGFVIGAIIVCILAFIIARAAGLIKLDGFGSGFDSQVESQEDGELVEDETSDVSDKVKTPKLVEMTEDNALALLEQMGLKGNKTGEEVSEYAAGIVISQEIAEGTAVESGTVINYVVSSGNNSPAVPEVNGFSQSEAEAKIKALGLETAIKQEYSDSVAIGKVIRSVTKKCRPRARSMMPISTALPRIRSMLWFVRRKTPSFWSCATAHGLWKYGLTGFGRCPPSFWTAIRCTIP